MLLLNVPTPETVRLSVPRPLLETLRVPPVMGTAAPVVLPPSTWPLRLKSSSPVTLLALLRFTVPITTKRFTPPDERGDPAPNAKFPLALTAPVENAAEFCKRSSPEPSVPLLSTSIMRPLVAMLEPLSEPKEMAY